MADAGESTDDDANDVAGDTDAGDAAAEIVMAAAAAAAEAAASVIMLVAAAMVLGRERLLIPLMPLIPSAAAAAAGVAGSEAGDRGWCPCAESYKAIEWSSSRSKRCASAT